MGKYRYQFFDLQNHIILISHEMHNAVYAQSSRYIYILVFSQTFIYN
jgi:hypothetical protein